MSKKQLTPQIDVAAVARKAIERAQTKQTGIPTADLVRSNLWIIDKHGQWIRYQPKPAQLYYRQNKGQRNLILKARQIGFSTEIQSEDFVAAVTSTCFLATLAHDAKTTAKLRRMAKRFHGGMPEDIRPEQDYDNAETTVYTNTKSEVTIATAGSYHIGRGGTYNRVHGSETAFWTDAESIMAGLLQGVPKEGVIELESTPNGASGYFYQRCMESLDGATDWKLFFFPWWWEDEYALPLERGEARHMAYSEEELFLIEKHNLTPQQIKWRRSKQRELRTLFIQEYPEDVKQCFLRSGAGYFGELSCYDAPIGAEYAEDHKYYAGLDFAQTQDYTVLSIWDRTAKCQVDLLRLHRLPWSEMRRRVLVKLKQWHVAACWAEANSMGTTNIEAIKSERHSHDVTTRIIPFQTTNLSKSAIMSDLHEALHLDGWKLLPILDQKREMEGFMSKQTIGGLWQLSAPDGEHDDIVIANALACHACLQPASIAFEVG